MHPGRRAAAAAREGGCPRREARDVKSKIATFLRQELKLELSQSKTPITHATSQAARFLGHEIKAQHSDVKITRRRRAVNGAIGLFVPKAVIRQRCALYMSRENRHDAALCLTATTSIVAKDQAEYAGPRPALPPGPGRVRLGRLHWVLQARCLSRWQANTPDGQRDGAKYKAVIGILPGRASACR